MCGHEHLTPACEKLSKKDLSLRPALATEWETLFPKREIKYPTPSGVDMSSWFSPFPPHYPHHPVPLPSLVPSVCVGGSPHFSSSSHFYFCPWDYLQEIVTSLSLCVLFVLFNSLSSGILTSIFWDSALFLLVLLSSITLPVSSVLLLSYFAIS